MAPHHLNLSLTRPQFEMMTSDLLARNRRAGTGRLCGTPEWLRRNWASCWSAAATRMPAVERQVKEILGKGAQP